MNDTTIIFKLAVKDVQLVAEDTLARNLTQHEMTLILDHIDEYISLYDEVKKCIKTLIKE